MFTWTLLSFFLVTGQVMPDAATPIPLPLLDEFDGDTLAPAWRTDVSDGNSMTLVEGMVRIHAAENTYAHLQRPLGRDLIRAAAVLKPGNGISWANALFLYWGPGDWCQLAVITRGDGRYYACVTTHGQRQEFDLERCPYDSWHHVAIELAEDGLRFLAAPDRGDADPRLLLLIDRPATLQGPPELLIVGKGFGTGTDQPHLNADYGERGVFAESWICRVSVSATPPTHQKILASERRAQAEQSADPLGAALLARDAEPDFAAVAALFGPIREPRESSGVPEHRFEIGIEYDGTIQLADESDLWEQTGRTAFLELGTPPERLYTTPESKHLHGKYLPVVISTGRAGDFEVRQTAFGWSEGFSIDAPLAALVRWEITHLGTAATASEARVATRPADLGFATDPVQITLQPGATTTLAARIPSPLLSPIEWITPDAYAARLAEAEKFWPQWLSAGLWLVTPEARVNAAHRSWLIYNALIVDTIDGRPTPHDGSGFYEEPFGYSAALYCHALDLWGRHDDARRYLRGLVSRIRPDGLFAVRYGLPDHGALLLALHEHFRLTGDVEWARSVAPDVARMCAWIQQARRPTSAEAALPLVRGLIRYRPYADYADETYNYYANAYCCVGLEHGAALLQAAGNTELAATATAEAARYRQDILASMQAAVVEHDGHLWLPMEPDTQRILKSTGYRAGGYYGLVAAMLLETEFLPAEDPRARLVANALERHGGLILGMCEFDEGIDHAYTYGYWLHCLDRGDVRRVLLGWYGTLAHGMSRETYAGVEVTQITTGKPTPTMPHLYSGTQQLRLLRMMLVRERGTELHLGPAMPQGWLATTEPVTIERAPTAFGEVSVRWQRDGDTCRVRLVPPTRQPPERIRLFVRVAGRRVAGLEGADALALDAESVTFNPQTGPMELRVRLAPDDGRERAGGPRFRLPD